MTRLVHPAWLVVLWVALWGSVTPANVAGGVAVAAGIVFITRRRRPLGQVVIRPWWALKFASAFLASLVRSSAVVALEVITRRSRIRTGIIALPLRGCSDTLVTLIADVISLTPGTLTVELRRNPLTLYVHVLHLHDIDKVRRSVRQIEVLAVRAFGTAEALAGLTGDDTEAWSGPPP
jgi:multicomponent Na+:H+ antiporter subunit E